MKYKIKRYIKKHRRMYSPFPDVPQKERPSNTRSDISFGQGLLYMERAWALRF